MKYKRNNSVLNLLSTIPNLLVLRVTLVVLLEALCGDRGGRRILHKAGVRLGRRELGFFIRGADELDAREQSEQERKPRNDGHPVNCRERGVIR